MSQFLGNGIAGSQMEGTAFAPITAAGSGASQAALMRSLNGRGDINGTIQIIGKVEQQDRFGVARRRRPKGKGDPGVTQTINGVASIPGSTTR